MVKMEASSAFASEVHDAIAVYYKEKEGQFEQQSYVHEVLTGWTVEKTFLWLTSTEFEQTYKVKPEALGIAVEQLAIGTAKPQPGILLRDTSEGAGVRVRGFWTIQGALGTERFKGATQVRPDQGREIAEWHQSQEHRGVPKALLDPKVHKGPGLADIPKLLAKHQEDQELEEERLKAQASLLANPSVVPAEEAAPVQQVAVETKEEVEEVESEGDDIIEHIPSQSKVLQRAEGKGRGKGKKSRKGRGKKGQGRGAEALPRAPAETALDAASVISGVTRLSGDSEGTMQLPADKAASKARSWVTTIDVGAMLDGKNHGRDLWGAQQSLEAMEKKQGVTAESILLRSHLDVANLAKECGLPSKILSFFNRLS